MPAGRPVLDTHVVSNPSNNQCHIHHLASGFWYTLPMGLLLGCARVSTVDQKPDLQIDDLSAAGCYEVFVNPSQRHRGPEEPPPRRHRRRVEARPPRRSLADLLAIVTGLQARDVGFRILRD